MTGEQVSGPAEAPLAFSMIGLEIPAGAAARFRTSADNRSWSSWEEIEALEEDDFGPDEPSTEAEGATPLAGGRRFTEATWVGEARWLQVALEGAAPSDVDAVFIDSNGLSAGTTAAPVDIEPPVPAADSDGAFTAAAARPPMISRGEWGADESLRRGAPAYAPAARYAVVHHTAGSNSYSRSEAPAVVRGIYHYHTQSLGWDDIAYNILVDRFGRIFEGRAGGLDRAVIGAHSRGFNTGAIGVAMLGEFTSSAAPDVAVGAVAAAIAWKFGVHGIGLGDTVRVVSGGSTKYAEGAVVNLPPIVAHRDVGLTECPGDAYYGQMGLLRRSVELRSSASSSPPPSFPPPSAPAAVFSDIGGSVHANSIIWLEATGVTNGCGGGRYCPNDRISRAQAVTMLHRALGRTSGSGQRFRDVPADSPHAGSIAAAVDAGIISGYPDGSFRPSASLRREQMASVVAKSAGLARQPGQYFRDVPWVSPHLANVNAIGRAGISTGCGDGNFCPDQRVTRGQMASLIVRVLQRR